MATEITRIFNEETRLLSPVTRAYAGVIGDSLATTIHFEYDPVGFLTGKVPYIQFAVYDDDENPYTYSVDSTPVFDGLTFQIPWEVTSRVKNQKLEYQLIFVSNDVTFEPPYDVAQLESTTYILSAVDGFVLKRNLQCAKKRPYDCCGTAPGTSPNIQGYIELFKEYAVMNPVKVMYDPTTNNPKFYFNTYNGTNNEEIELLVPKLDENNKIPSSYLHMITQWGTQTNTNLPSSKLVFDSLALKTDKLMAIAPWDPASTYSSQSTVMYNENIYISIQDNNTNHNPDEDAQWWSTVTEMDIIVTDWEATLSDHKVPSEKLTKEALDAKLDDSQLVTEWSGIVSDSNIPSEKLTKDSLDAKLDDIQLVTEWSGTVSDSNIPSEKLTKDNLDEKTDIVKAIGTWDPALSYSIESTVMKNLTLYISMADDNLNHDPLESGSIWWEEVKGSGGGGEGAVSLFRLIGNGTDKIYNINHGFGTLNVFTAVRSAVQPYDYVDVKVTAVSANYIRLTFNSAPAYQSIIVTVSPGAGVIAPSEGFNFTQETASDTWTIAHDLGRIVTVQTYTEDGEQIEGAVTQNGSDIVTVSFNEAVAGYAIIY